VKIGFQQIIAIPFLHLQNFLSGIVIWISWVDNYLFVGHKEEVSKHKG
jgi:hypothetical protein